MKEIGLTAAVAALVGGLVAYGLAGRSMMDHTPAMFPTVVPGPSGPAPAQTVRLSFTDALVEDVWIDASRGAGSDHRVLTSIENSVCFITKIEIGGIQSPADRSACAMEVDEFTGFWDLVATVEEGGQSRVRCNARCLVWE